MRQGLGQVPQSAMQLAPAAHAFEERGFGLLQHRGLLSWGGQGCEVSEHVVVLHLQELLQGIVGPGRVGEQHGHALQFAAHLAHGRRPGALALLAPFSGGLARILPPVEEAPQQRGELGGLGQQRVERGLLGPAEARMDRHPVGRLLRDGELRRQEVPQDGALQDARPELRILSVHPQEVARDPLHRVLVLVGGGGPSVRMHGRDEPPEGAHELRDHRLPDARFLVPPARAQLFPGLFGEAGRARCEKAAEDSHRLRPDLLVVVREPLSEGGEHLLRRRVCGPILEAVLLRCHQHPAPSLQNLSPHSGVLVQKPRQVVVEQASVLLCHLEPSGERQQLAHELHRCPPLPGVVHLQFDAQVGQHGQEDVGRRGVDLQDERVVVVAEL
mmetsp:Transcript_34469/g.97219  ORF Transcript_34469/g.97219 Transcript_34469/m.97219 type:complete len:386 (-) Transcript_34469:646-1803(-)